LTIGIGHNRPIYPSEAKLRVYNTEAAQHNTFS